MYHHIWSHVQLTDRFASRNDLLRCSIYNPRRSLQFPPWLDSAQYMQFRPTNEHRPEDTRKTIPATDARSIRFFDWISCEWRMSTTFNILDMLSCFPGTPTKWTWFVIRQYAIISNSYFRAYDPSHSRYCLRSSIEKNTSCRLLPLWVMWWGIPVTTILPILGMLLNYINSSRISKKKGAVPFIPT